jgi:hypothetical protein
MVFVTQIMVCELNFQEVSNCVGFLGRMKYVQGPKHHEGQLVSLVQPPLGGISQWAK